jgi:uncharacterized protein
MEFEVDGVEVLSDDECLALLGQERVGRVAVTIGALPAVFPVNYALAGHEIMFFTGEGTKLRAATTNAVVAFEVDHVDPFSEAGWSVLVVGLAKEKTDPVVVAGARASGLHPWAAGDRFHLVALGVDFLSGRRLHNAKAAERGQAGSAAGPSSPISALAHRPVRVGQDWALRSVASTMRDTNVSSVLVAPDDAIVTERDLTKALTAGLGPDAPVINVAVTHPVAVDEDATIVEAAAQMLDHDIRHLVIQNHRGETIGLVSLRDLMHILLDAMDPAALTALREQLSAS